MRRRSSSSRCLQPLNFLVLLALLLSGARICGDTRPQLDLTGTWSFYPDVGNATMEQVTAAPGSIVVPGSWQAQGFGEPGGTIPSANIGPGSSPADYLRHNLMGRCLYARNVEVPAEWQKRRVFLCVRRAYRYTDAAVNGKSVGEYEGFSTPFEFDVTDALAFGQTNRIVLGVDNRPRQGRNTLGTGNLYGNWGGIGGAVYLESRPSLHLSDVFVMPQVATSRAVLRIDIHGSGGSWPTGLRVQSDVMPWSADQKPADRSGTATMPVPQTDSNQLTIDLQVPITSPRLWSPDDPYLYVTRVQLLREEEVADEVSVRFGMREITADGRKLLLNGKPLYLSGYGDDATEPLTGMLPADKAEYRKRLSLMRSLGFNFVRHHSCVPHDEYLAAADELGMLVQPEASLAYTGFWQTGHQLFEQEWPRIVRAFRNHPSIWAWCMGNELFLNEVPETVVGEKGISRTALRELLERAYHEAKQLDPTRLIHTSDGGTPQPFTDVLSNGRSDASAKPYLLHEYGTYCCSLPNFSLIPRLSGVIRPLTYERAERYVREHRLESSYPLLYRSSLMMRADAQKHYLEAARSSGSNAGFSFWLGVDFPDSPEGCWDEGIVNQLWEPKPYLTNNLSDINGPTTLLTSAGLDSRSFYSGEPKNVGLRLWHYGAQPIEAARLSWRLLEAEQLLQSGEFTGIACGPGELRSVADIPIAPLQTKTPRFLSLRAELTQGTKRVARNTWEFYVYPHVDSSTPRAGVYSEAGPVEGAVQLAQDEAFPADLRVLITKQLKGDRHRELLRRGRASVLLLGTGGFKESRAGYFLNAHGTGFGGIIEPHPIFASIPHEGRLHLGIHQLVAGGGLLETESMPAAVRDGSIVWGLRLTGWISPIKNLRKVAHVCEVMADNQLHLVLCNMDLLSDKPESRYVMEKAIDYLLGQQVSPLAKACSLNDLEQLLR